MKETNVGFKLTQAMLSKQVDATLGAFWNYEGVDLQRRGRHPEILRMEDVGVPTYNELIFVARRSDLDEDGASRLRRFLQATARGHELLRAQPQAGVDALLDADPGLDRGLQEAAVKATLPVFFPEDDERPFGYQDPAQWAAYERWMRDSGLLKQPQAERPPLTNEFLPGEGLDPGTSGLDETAGGGVHEVRAGQPLPLAVALEEAAHLGLVGAGARVAGDEPADDLQEAEVAGRDEVVAALAVQGDHLARPRADLAHARRRRRRSWSCRSSRPAATASAQRRMASARLGARSNETSRAGAWPAITAGVGASRMPVSGSGSRTRRSAAAGSPSRARARSAAR